MILQVTPLILEQISLKVDMQHLFQRHVGETGVLGGVFATLVGSCQQDNFEMFLVPSFPIKTLLAKLGVFSGFI